MVPIPVSFMVLPLHFISSQKKEYVSNLDSIPKDLQTTNKFSIKKKVYSSHSWADQILLNCFLTGVCSLH